MSEQQRAWMARERTPAEAIDLGTAFLRRFARPLYSFFAPPLLLATLGLSFLPGPWVWVGPLVIWWLKPLWDCLLVLPASRLAFRPDLTFPELVASLKSLSIAKLFAELTILRFSPLRSFLLPAKLLEGLKGRDRQKRLKLLSRHGQNSAALLTFACLGLEVALFFSWIPLVQIFSPDFLGRLRLGESWTLLVCEWVYVGGLLFVEPLYALGGFGLYLNRRTTLEGWDLDLVFKSLKKRRIAKVPLLLLAFFFCLAVPVRAEQETKVDEDRSVKAVEKVLSGTDFGGEKTIFDWVPNEVKKPEKTNPSIQPKTSTPLEVPSQGLLIVVLIVGALALVGLIATFFVLRKKKVEKLKTVSGEVSERPLNSENLVEPTWADLCLELWQAGRLHDAFAMLYRSGLEKILSSTLEKIPEAATEGEVRKLAQKIPETDRLLLENLLKLRVYEAYAGQGISEKSFLEILNAVRDLPLRQKAS